MKVKPLVQVKEAGEKMDVCIHLLITRETLQMMIDEIARNPVHNVHLKLSLPAIDAEVIVEAYEPGQASNLFYTKNLLRDDWKTVVASVL